MTWDARLSVTTQAKANPNDAEHFSEQKKDRARKPGLICLLLSGDRVFCCEEQQGEVVFSTQVWAFRF